MQNLNKFASQRFEVFSREVIRPALYTNPSPLDVKIYQCPDPIPYSDAIKADYEHVSPGLKWGPAWSTAWFMITGRIPKEMSGKPVVLRFDCGTEAMLWKDGVPLQGFDCNRDTAHLLPDAKGGESILYHVEAACNTPFGLWTPEEDVEQTRRWQEETPGRLYRCDLAVWHEVIWHMLMAYDFAWKLLRELPDDSQRSNELNVALSAATAAIDPYNVAGSAEHAHDLLFAVLDHEPGVTNHCYAVGHAHIDTAWLWRVRETRRKCIRSFTNVIRLMERFDDFKFLCSQAAQYEFIEEDSPELFKAISKRVEEGRWEASGGLWVEPDGNIPSGESFARQMIYSRKYWVEKFGEKGEQSFIYLPDTFGYSAALPTIMKAAGIDTFITNKLSWNQTNEFPHINFRWRGLDGSEVLAHCTPGRDYNAKNTPEELRRGASNHARQDRSGLIHWLQPFGWGDGGGGPEDWMIQYAKLAAHSDGVPRTTLGTTNEFCEALHEDFVNLKTEKRDLPVWDGELYLELHRGTLTTQGWLKRANRKAECELFRCEWLLFGGPSHVVDDSISLQLQDTWKTVLLNQFHDILPGSSITEVYEDAMEEYKGVEANYTYLNETGIKLWAESLDSGDMFKPVAVFNSTSAPFSGVVETPEGLHYVNDVPALGAKVIDAAPAPAVEPVSISDDTISNGQISATIDRVGRVTNLTHKGTNRNACIFDRFAELTVPMNQMVLYEDHPRMWDAWDIDEEYPQLGTLEDTPAEQWNIIEDTPLRGIIEVERPIGHASRIRQRFILTADSPRLDIETTVEWYEKKRMLRALFPTSIRNRFATYAIQNGYLVRPATRNNSWEQAAFEVCGHSWMAVAEHGFGVALLNNGKYGHSCEGRAMGLTLLRSPESPDKEADQGVHHFTYSLMPYSNDWRQAGVDRQAEILNTPPMSVAMKSDQAGGAGTQWAPFSYTTTENAGVTFTAVKNSEEGDDLVIRFVETHGGSGILEINWNLAVSEVVVTDLHERPMPPTMMFSHRENRTIIALKPFQLVTLLVKR